MAEFQEVLKQRERMCHKRMCSNCELYAGNNEIREQCHVYMFTHPKETEEAIMKWAKDHPVKTNLDKLIEIFPMFDREGIDPSDCYGFPCPQNGGCDECEYYNFWLQEYKEPRVNNNEEKNI